jgi:hypothetical protein
MALILWPIVWLLSIPFRIVGIAAEAFLALIKAILFLPARLLGQRDNDAFYHDPRTFLRKVAAGA